MNGNFENLKDLTVNQTNPCKIIVFTETWSMEKKANNNSFFLILNSSLISQIRKFSLKGGGVVVFIHKSLNYKIIHYLSKSNDIVKTLRTIKMH